MAKLSMRVHQFEKRGSRDVMVKVNPYLRIKDGEKGTYFLQKGRCFNAGGVQTECPNWVLEYLLEKINPKSSAEVGFTKEHIEGLRGGAPELPPEPDLEPYPEPLPADPPNRSLTEEEANDMEFSILRAYANERGITGRAKEDLMERLKEEGHVH